MTKYLAHIGITILLSASFTEAQSASAATSLLENTFDLGPRRTRSTQFFVMESKLIVYALDGERIGTDIYRLRLKCVPGKDGDEYTCAGFTWQPHGGSEADIPTLANWSHVFQKSGGGQKGNVFGIDRSKFDKISDSTGKVLGPDKAYHVYNAFIDFHAFCDVFADRTGSGRGIQDLKKIGDKIVHVSAFSEPPVGPGSFFKNGEVTLEFKGLSKVGRKSCALVGYDSGESSFKMMNTVGSSHYFGDIYKDLESGWVQKATMTEIVVSETTLPTPPNKANAVIERLIEIRNVSQKEFNAPAKN